MRKVLLGLGLLVLVGATGCGEGGLTNGQGPQFAIASVQYPIMAALTAAPHTPQGAKVYSAVAGAIKSYCGGLRANHLINRDNINAFLVDDDIAIVVTCPDEAWPDDPRR